MSKAPPPTPIRTHCAACDNRGLTLWDELAGIELDVYLQALRTRCPDCGASGRTATVMAEGPDPAAEPEMASMWEELQAFVAADPLRRQPKVGRNEPCPCGSGEKFKRCCG